MLFTVLPQVHDDEVKEAIQNGLDDAGYKTPKQIKSENIQHNSAAMNWISFARLFVKINMLLGSIASIAAGVYVIENIGLFVGIMIIALGILSVFLSAALIMIFLNMAEDINSIKRAQER